MSYDEYEPGVTIREVRGWQDTLYLGGWSGIFGWLGVEGTWWASLRRDSDGYPVQINAQWSPEALAAQLVIATGSTPGAIEDAMADGLADGS